MNKPNWTPGPWQVRTPDGIWSGFVIECKDLGTPIYPFIFQKPITCVNSDEWQANAHLIAAAPELYEALSGLMAEIADCSQFDLWDHTDKARAALSKARGES